jgi:hypothetical protein
VVSRPGRFTPGQRDYDAYIIGGWVDLRADLEALAKLNSPGNRPWRPIEL